MGESSLAGLIHDTFDTMCCVICVVIHYIS
jgi:hypothetical protein